MTGRRDGRRRGAALAAALCVLAATACGGDSPTDSEAPLTERESADLAVAVAEQAEGVLVARTDEAGPASPSGSDGAPLGGTILFSRSRACPLGGQATMAGRLERSFDPGSEELTVDFSMTIVHEGCVVRSGSRTLRLTGSPGLDVRAGYRELEGRLDGPQRASVEGEVEWSTDAGAAGSCRVSVETVLDPAAGSFSVRGEACGFAVDRTLDR